MATKVQMPKLSDTMTEGVILKWRYKEGDKVKQGDVLVEIESDKADMELEAYDSGILRKIFVAEGGKAPIGAPIAIIAGADEDITAMMQSGPAASATTESPKAAVPAAAAPQAHAAAAPVQPSATGRVKASPLARRLASENKVDIGRIPGSGPLGRVVRKDVEAAVAHGTFSTAPPFKPAVRKPTQDLLLSPIRKTIAKKMAESKQTVPHFQVTMEVDMEPCMAFRDQINSLGDVKIGFTDILLKACGFALARHPQVNATYLGESMRQHGDIHISVAVALEDGLVTPVVRHCDQKTIEDINRELRDLVERARIRKLKPEEYAGGTFTVSNLGMFGVSQFVAIITPPEGAILAVGSIVEKPVVKKGVVVVGHTMNMTLSADHRIIDGAVAARFMQDLTRILENPAILLFRA